MNGKLNTFLKLNVYSFSPIHSIVYSSRKTRVLKKACNLHVKSGSCSGFSCSLYSSVIQTQDNLLGFVSKTAMWVELLCQCRACPPPVVLMLSELLSNSQKGSESACTGRQVCLCVDSQILLKRLSLVLVKLVKHRFFYVWLKEKPSKHYLAPFTSATMLFITVQWDEVVGAAGKSQFTVYQEIITIN